MPQSLSRIDLHVVFSTKTRERSIISAVEERLHAYMATVVRDLGCEAYRVGGTDDHVHLAVRMSRTIRIEVDERYLWD
jgi:REP element-mobilizing transposase RayT